MDRRVVISKYSSIVPTSMEIAKKFSVSTKDKNFENLDILDEALRAPVVADGCSEEKADHDEPE